MTFLIKFANQFYKSKIQEMVCANFPYAKIQTFEKFKLDKHYSNTEKIYIFVDQENFNILSTENQISDIITKNTFLIMVADNADFVIQCIRYGYYDYLLGNTLKADLELFFERLNAQLLIDLKLNVKNHILIKEHKSNTKLPYNNIVYIEAYGSYSNLYTENRIYTISKTIKSIIHNFPVTFVRVHRSYAVNLDHVQSFSAEEVIMNNETRIKISRTRKMALSEAIQRTA